MHKTWNPKWQLSDTVVQVVYMFFIQDIQYEKYKSGISNL